MSGLPMSAALAEAFAELDPAIRRAVRRRFPAAPGHLADDASGRTWEIAARHWDRLAEFDPDHRRAYLIVVARHEALAELKHGDRERPTDELFSGSYTVDAELEARELLRAVSRLPRAARLAVEARLAGEPYAETATRLDRTYTWVNRWTSRGRETLAGALQG